MKNYKTKSILLILLSFACIASSGCFIFKRKTTCPAYMNGAATGTGGTKSKHKQELFPKKMHK